MPATVHLNDVIDALEMQFDESPFYLDVDAGRVVTVSEDLLREAEEPDLPDWQKDEWEIAKRIVSTDRFRPLPTKFDVHEWGIMEDFSRSVASEGIRDDLLRAIHGAGAFRSFKDTVRRLGSNRRGLHSARKLLGGSHSTGAKKIRSLGSRGVAAIHRGLPCHFANYLA